MFKTLFIDDRAEETRRSIAQFTEEGLLGQEDNFQVEVLGPTSFEEMGKQLFDLFVEQRTYQALLLDWNLSEVATAGFTAGYRAAELGQYLRREIAEKDRGDVCFPIFVLSAQRYIKDLYAKDKASHDIFDNVYEREDFLLRKNTKSIIDEINLFTSAYSELHKIYEKDKDLKKINSTHFKKIFALLLAKGDFNLLNFSELNIPHPYGYLKFIHHEMLRKPGVLIDEQLLCTRLGINCDSFGMLAPHLESAVYKGVMHEGYQRWWMSDIEKWWETISSEPLIFLDASDRVTLINSKLDLSLKCANALGDDYNTFFWHVSKLTGAPLDESDALRLIGSKKFDWQEYQYLSKEDYITGAYELQANESVDSDEIASKLN